tara:strand:- start:250 stop:444 length:195 start_codon:yes stop_codon:yes gene_type:complete
MTGYRDKSPSWDDRLAACDTADEVVGMCGQRKRMADEGTFPGLSENERNAAVVRRLELINAGRP